MNPFLRITSKSLNWFFLGCGSGFSIGLVLPDIGRTIFKFQLERTEQLITKISGFGGNISLTLIIYLSNIAITTLIAILPLSLFHYVFWYRKKHPFKLDNPDLETKNEISLLLNIYSRSILFAYGFSVFGLFLAFIFSQYLFLGLLLWASYLIPHGIMEAFAIVTAASAGIVIRDYYLKYSQDSCKEIFKQYYPSYLIFISIILFIASLIEVYFSLKFMSFVDNIFDISNLFSF